MNKSILVTGAGGLIGSEAVDYFCKRDFRVTGIDNNQREVFFGSSGSTKGRIDALKDSYNNFFNLSIDIRNRQAINDLFDGNKFETVIHAAAQPSHDRAASIPFDDFETNAVGTLNLLEALKNSNRDCNFVHLSTNKVYGDAPNRLALIESEQRYDFADDIYKEGIDENFPIDQSTHSLFGASKLAADILVQEYGRYFDMPTVVLRGGCLTGENHSAVQLHGFLNYLVKCNISKSEYTIFGYKGKQVRDNIHAYDVIQFVDLFCQNPKKAAVYNIGGGRLNSCSILEAIKLIETVTGIPMIYSYSPTNRVGDHICYYSNLSRIKSDFPNFTFTYSLRETLERIASQVARQLNH